MLLTCHIDYITEVCIAETLLQFPKHPRPLLVEHLMNFISLCIVIFLYFSRGELAEVLNHSLYAELEVLPNWIRKGITPHLASALKLQALCRMLGKSTSRYVINMLEPLATINRFLMSDLTI